MASAFRAANVRASALLAGRLSFPVKSRESARRYSTAARNSAPESVAAGLAPRGLRHENWFARWTALSMRYGTSALWPRGFRRTFPIPGTAAGHFRIGVGFIHNCREQGALFWWRRANLAAR